MNAISGRRVAGFIALTVTIIAVTLVIGFVLSSQQLEASPTGGPDVPATGAATARAPTSTALTQTTAAPTPFHEVPPPPTKRTDAVASDAPALGGTIPPFVPVPSGPNP